MNADPGGDRRAPLRVVVLEPGYESYAAERRVLEPQGVELTAFDWQGRPERIGPALHHADAVLVRESPLDRQVVSTMRRCRVIVRYGVGVDNIDLDAARDQRIYVANVPDYGSEEVSDHAVALFLAVARRILTRDREVRRGEWGVGQRQRIQRIGDGVLGLIGYGRIARLAHRKFAAFGFRRTCVADPGLDRRQAQRLGVELVDVDTLCAECDVISLHAPVTAATRHLIDARRIGLMKPEAILVNTARGALVDEPALVLALRERRLRGAGIDVFESEPPGRDHPLFELDNVVLSDHTAWYSEASVRELQTQAAEEVARVFAGQPPRNWVNRWDE